jgi:hypothetical protein
VLVRAVLVRAVLVRAVLVAGRQGRSAQAPVLHTAVALQAIIARFKRWRFECAA